jgi:hypothetical protein
MGEGRNVYRVLVGMPEGERPLERPWRGWEDGIKMALPTIMRFSGIPVLTTTC